MKKILLGILMIAILITSINVPALAYDQNATEKNAVDLQTSAKTNVSYETGVYFVDGVYKVYCCTGGHHGWVEIDGKVYDPSFAGARRPIKVFGLPYKAAMKKNPGGGYGSLFEQTAKWRKIKL